RMRARDSSDVALQQSRPQVIAQAALLHVVEGDRVRRIAPLPTGVDHRPAERGVLAVVADALVESVRRFERAAAVEDVESLEVGRRPAHVPPQRPVPERVVLALAHAALYDAEARAGSQ